jgi:hypothetical protein
MEYHSVMHARASEWGAEKDKGSWTSWHELVFVLDPDIYSLSPFLRAQER